MIISRETIYYRTVWVTCQMHSGHTREVPVVDGSETYQRSKVVLPINVTEVGSEQCMNGHYLQVGHVCSLVELISSYQRHHFHSMTDTVLTQPDM